MLGAEYDPNQILFFYYGCLKYEFTQYFEEVLCVKALFVKSLFVKSLFVKSLFVKSLFDEVTGSDVADYEVTVWEVIDLEDADWEVTIEGTGWEELVCERAVCNDEGFFAGLLGHCLECENEFSTYEEL